MDAPSQQSSCQHYPECGGCSLQHLSPEEYREHKQRRVAALATRLQGETSALQELFEVGLHSRRRGGFRVASQKGEVSLGFHAARSHEVVDMHECLILRPEIFSLIAPLRECLRAMKKPGVFESIRLTIVEGGLDMACTTQSPMKPQDKAALLEFVSTQPVVRLCENGQRLYGNTAQVRLGGLEVELPPESFLQASEAAQEALIASVQSGLTGCRQVVDLYSGCGTFSLPLAGQGARVSAYEGAAEMAAALHNAAQ